MVTTESTAGVVDTIEIEAQGARAALAVAQRTERINELQERRRHLSLDVVSGDGAAKAALAGIEGELAALRTERHLAEDAVEEAQRRIAAHHQAEETARRVEAERELDTAAVEAEAVKAELAAAARTVAEAVARLVVLGDRMQGAGQRAGLGTVWYRRGFLEEATEALRLALFEAGVPDLGLGYLTTFEHQEAERRRAVRREDAAQEAAEAEVRRVAREEADRQAVAGATVVHHDGAVLIKGPGVRTLADAVAVLDSGDVDAQER